MFARQPLLAARQDRAETFLLYPAQPLSARSDQPTERRPDAPAASNPAAPDAASNCDSAPASAQPPAGARDWLGHGPRGGGVFVCRRDSGSPRPAAAEVQTARRPASDKAAQARSASVRCPTRLPKAAALQPAQPASQEVQAHSTPAAPRTNWASEPQQQVRRRPGNSVARAARDNPVAASGARGG